MYRDVNSLDPIYAFDYPENTAVSLLCESLLRQSPDGAVRSGPRDADRPRHRLGSCSPSSRVRTSGTAIRSRRPMSSTAWSAARSSTLGGFYTQVFTRVKSIAATGSNQVTITLKQPDYWLQGELASMPGIVIEKKFAEAQGKNYGTPAGSIMCTGAYKYKSFSPGVGVTAVPTRTTGTRRCTRSSAAS